MVIRTGQGASPKRDIKTLHHSILEKEVGAYMVLLPHFLPENEGRWTVFYQGNPLGFWDSLDDIDIDYVRNVVGKYISRESMLIHQVTELDLKYGFGKGRGAKIRRVLESDINYQGNILH